IKSRNYGVEARALMLKGVEDLAADKKVLKSKSLKHGCALMLKGVEDLATDKKEIITHDQQYPPKLQYMNHFVVMIGHGRQGSQEFAWIQNSWGTKKIPGQSGCQRIALG
ncbi:hypothetical protein FRX31_030629, partial [Thalictrum thalictroides]